MSTPLFRQQAIEHANNKLYGNVLVTPKISHSIFAVIAFLWVVFLLYLAIAVRWDVNRQIPVKVVYHAVDHLELVVPQTMYAEIKFEDAQAVQLKIGEGDASVYTVKVIDSEQSFENVRVTVSFETSVESRIESSLIAESPVFLIVPVAEQNFIEWSGLFNFGSRGGAP